MIPLSKNVRWGGGGGAVEFVLLPPSRLTATNIFFSSSLSGSMVLVRNCPLTDLSSESVAVYGQA